MKTSELKRGEHYAHKQGGNWFRRVVVTDPYISRPVRPVKGIAVQVMSDDGARVMSTDVVTPQSLVSSWDDYVILQAREREHKRQRELSIAHRRKQAAEIATLLGLSDFDVGLEVDYAKNYAKGVLIRTSAIDKLLEALRASK